MTKSNTPPWGRFMTTRSEPPSDAPTQAQTMTAVPGALLYVCIASAPHFRDGLPSAQSLFLLTPFPTAFVREEAV